MTLSYNTFIYFSCLGLWYDLYQASVSKWLLFHTLSAMWICWMVWWYYYYFGTSYLYLHSLEKLKWLQSSVTSIKKLNKFWKKERHKKMICQHLECMQKDLQIQNMECFKSSFFIQQNWIVNSLDNLVFMKMLIMVMCYNCFKLPCLCFLWIRGLFSCF